MYQQESAMAACICADTALQTYVAGVLVDSGNCCNVAVSVSGWGFSGRIEWDSSRYDYLYGTHPSCASVSGCVQEDPDDYRFTPGWGSGWGEDGFGTISFYKNRDPQQG